ncbi:hypothetical protein [Borrelia miyamotoi]|uniref:Uncharacterized protein n=1 Tax=Borrelia miyamotoi TaxID=47466 RepID=A0AAQ2WYD6_9SPIR|nr:hypothetical protein [Borrelia miyamotoi]AGT27305.1 hypothetical protein I871_01635 [Borrelia miyamotoi LB-2001]AJA58488.1 hypothetical protein RJ61_01515 [Borrelia miyamotoi]AOW95564.1 hypothetical protein AXH25_01525 [Borrelia miyamotoi]QTL83449.1 hypothetical protein bmLB2001_000302 [Borrelia miyamotoi]WAZ85256.1 hypothetical protein O5400_02750 [Borrelia miyamotoi]
MDLVHSENYQKILLIDNLILQTLNEIKDIKKSGSLTVNSEIIVNFINLNLNVLSYIASLNYFYTRPRLKVNYDFRTNLFNFISDFSLFVSPILLISARELMTNESLLDLNPEERFLIVNKLGYLIDLGLYFSKGDSKSVLFLEDIYLKFIILTKNFIDFKNLSKNLLIDSPFYKVQLSHLFKSLELLEEGAFLLRARYETNEAYGLSEQILNYIEAGRILAVVTSQKEVADKFAKFYEVWSVKFQSDLGKIR